MSDNLSAQWNLVMSTPLIALTLIGTSLAVGFAVSQFLGKRHRDIQDSRIAALESRLAAQKEQAEILLRLLSKPEMREEFFAMQKSPAKQLEIPGERHDWSEREKHRVLEFYELKNAGLADVKEAPTGTTVVGSLTAAKLWEELKTLTKD